LTWSASGQIPAALSLFHRRFSDFIYALDTGMRFSHDLEEEGFNSLAACSSDLADFDGDADEFAGSPECFSYIQHDAKFTGLEAEVTLPMTETHALRLWGDAVRARFDNNGDVPRMPPARMGANWDFASGYWTTRLSITYAFKQDRPGTNQTDTEDYTRVDAYVRYGVKAWSLFIKGANLTDEEIRNSTSFLRDIAPEPGRSIVIGANYSF
jgi:iron complex outermembrane receptor protein